MSLMDVFVISSGVFSALITVPMILLAVWARRESTELRKIQDDLVSLMVGFGSLAEAMHLLQEEIRTEQHDAVAAAEIAARASSRAVHEVGTAVDAVGRMVDDLSEPDLEVTRP